MEGVTVKSLDSIEPYAGEHAIAGIRFRAARQALEVSSWGMNVLDFDARCNGYPEHDHTGDGQEEVYIVLRGAIVLQVDGKEFPLKAGDAVRVASELKRKFITRDEGARLLALGATPGKSYTPGLGG